MTQELVVTLFTKMMTVVGMIAGPLLIAGMIIGIVISILQAVTSIHEMTLTFVPKLVVVGLVLLFLFPWIMSKIVDFAHELFNNIAIWGG